MEAAATLRLGVRALIPNPNVVRVRVEILF
jgi:hypothetical protein